MNIDETFQREIRARLSHKIDLLLTSTEMLWNHFIHPDLTQLDSISHGLDDVA
jgi:hypothetical protein